MNEKIIRIPNSGKITIGKEFAGQVFLMRTLSSGDIVLIQGKESDKDEGSLGFHMRGLSDFSKVRSEMHTTTEGTGVPLKEKARATKKRPKNKSNNSISANN